MIKRPGVLLLLFSLAMTFSFPAFADDAIWIDVRTPQEFGEGHVDQAVNIPYDEIGARIASVTADQDATIYVYCRSGRRSGMAKATLDEMGYTRVVNIGGLEDALEKAGQPSDH